jgi:hypothetical protein
MLFTVLAAPALAHPDVTPHVHPANAVSVGIVGVWIVAAVVLVGLFMRTSPASDA